MALGPQLPRRERAVAGAAAQRLEERGEGHRISGNSQRADRRAGDRTTSGGESIRPFEQPVQRRGTTTRAPSGPEVAPLRLPMQSQSNPAETGGPSQPGLSTGAGPAQPTPLTVPSREGPTRSSFPHAFERWETLSAHWEGLTSFWLRRLEENSSEINRDPLSQQLSRQNTDLSAAGANLFHAVVELQRLRASSERKFQRWFFETREQEERATENLAVMAKQLEDERNSRTQAIKEAVESERRKDQSDKVIAELKRELEIARSEARRAWDELGRREAEERERTIALRDGQPTVLGGVQVVPMVQGVPSRHGSTAVRDLPPTRQGGPSDSGSGSARTGGRFADPESPTGSNETYQQYQRSQRSEPSDPFIESIRQRQAAAAISHSSAGPQYTQAPAVQPASPNTHYQQPEGRPSQSTQAGQGEEQYEGSNSDDEYEIDEQGRFVLDDAGNRIRYSSVSFLILIPPNMSIALVNIVMAALQSLDHQFQCLVSSTDKDQQLAQLVIQLLLLLLQSITRDPDMAQAVQVQAQVRAQAGSPFLVIITQLVSVMFWRKMKEVVPVRAKSVDANKQRMDLFATCQRFSSGNLLSYHHHDILGRILYGGCLLCGNGVLFLLFFYVYFPT
ncbi:hypothetical protein EYC80_000980 [Monilinia laxa]|uniref:Uncharacterized protein n=1 Tax=Monilinia laxa TaxID=61186 RepID=A0A5N6K7U2_MONLA|nr:hypothetical protein EYC80_000980 [Monilinia laxa]